MNSPAMPQDPSAATTFAQFVRAAAAAYGDDVAITLKGDTISNDAITFTELDRKSAEMARGLLARGVGKGTRIGFIYGNSPTFAVIFAAIARIGAVAVPISTLLKSNELVRVLRQSDVAGLIVQRKLLGHDYVDRLCDALPDLRTSANAELRLAQTPYLRWVLSSGEGLPAAIGDVGTLYKAAASVSEALLAEVESEVHPADQLMEVYTSGSMALPKGVRHNHGPVVFRTSWIRAISGVQRGAQMPATLPFFWVGGMIMMLFVGWEIGARRIVQKARRPTAKRPWAAC